MHSKAGDLRLLWLEKTPDEAKIRATEKEIRALRDQMQDKSSDYRWAVYKSLTPEQQALLKKNKATGRCFGAGPAPARAWARPRQRSRHGFRDGPRHGRKHEVTTRRETFFLDTLPFQDHPATLRRVILFYMLLFLFLGSLFFTCYPEPSFKFI